MTFFVIVTLINVVLILPKPNCELYKTSMQHYGLELWNSLPKSVKPSQGVYEIVHVVKGL